MSYNDTTPTSPDPQGMAPYGAQQGLPPQNFAPAPWQPAPAKGSNGLATAGFVLGLIGVLGSWIPILNFLSIVLGVIGIVLALVGLAKSGKVGAGKGLAIAGVVLSALAIILPIVVNVAFVNAVDEVIDEGTKTTVTSTDGEKSSSNDEGSLGSDRSNPAPLGSAVSGDDWTVTVNSVKKVSSDSMGQSAASGSTLIKVNVTAKYTGDDKQGDSAWTSLKFVTSDGTTIDSTDGSSLFIAEDEFDSLTKLYTGGSETGDQILEVPSKGWKDGVLAVSPSLLSDDTFIALQ